MRNLELENRIDTAEKHAKINVRKYKVDSSPIAAEPCRITVSSSTHLEKDSPQSEADHAVAIARRTLESTEWIEKKLTLVIKGKITTISFNGSNNRVINPLILEIAAQLEQLGYYEDDERNEVLRVLGFHAGGIPDLDLRKKHKQAIDAVKQNHTK